VVVNGREAIEEWKRASYDLILMDCQMPEVDGYQATREIRRLEGNGRRVWIVALTAHATADAQVACKAAGMDAFIKKPIDRLGLATCLDDLLIRQASGGAENATTPSVDAPMPPGQAGPTLVDVAALDAFVERDEVFRRKLITDFLSSTSKISSALLRDGLESDHAALAHLAHQLKGASGYIHAKVLERAAIELEGAATAGRAEALAELVKNTCDSIAATAEFLTLHYRI
jgi:CheY-like chemotaxis protein